MFLARKISFPKWETHPDLSAGEIQADAITADLRTFGNKLSVWRCGDAKPAYGDIQEAALAMASTMDRANKFDLVWFDKGELERAGFIIKQTAGETSVAGLSFFSLRCLRLGLHQAWCNCLPCRNGYLQRSIPSISTQTDAGFASGRC